MAFLAKGYLPGEGKYGDVIDRGIRYVMRSQRSDGLLADRTSHGPMYSHGVSTLMLAEVLGMADLEYSDELRERLARAVALIIQAQRVDKSTRHKGGWRYHTHSRDSDISCTGWQLMSLRAAKNCGCDVPIAAIREAVGYIRICASRGGGFGYQAHGSPNVARSGTGIVSLELCDRHLADEARRAGEFIARQPIQLHREGHFWYAMYYASQAMFQLGDKYWVPFRQRMETYLLTLQNPEGWFRPGRGNEGSAGPAYSTAMACLSLSVDYQLLPIYQRGEADPDEGE
jgi:hypothetical protein